MNETLSTIIYKGMNNPECSFFVGNFVGQYTMIKIIMALIMAYFVFKMLDVLALDPFLSWTKKKFKKLKKLVWRK